jgi:glyoxylase-like metal-dependent hydrolase (beta-lactamase superfamily II)
VALEIRRLSLGQLRGVDGNEWPVHGFVVTFPGGAVLVDTGMGGPQQWLDDWRAVNRSVAGALDELGLTPGDIGLVINTHLHFDHCGQNAVLPVSTSSGPSSTGRAARPRTSPTGSTS